MTAGKKSLIQNLCFRLAGLLLIIAGGLGLKLLCRVVNLPPAHEATLTEMVVAAVSFLGVTSGTALLFLGTHIFDPVRLSDRWAEPPDRQMTVEQRHIAPTQSSSHFDGEAGAQHRSDPKGGRRVRSS
ncbi:hypothetical protein Sphch_1029 [Sphingobium chlorophenolicum L-1]|uniref:Uncharacterized protein n=1 Tax=Sphingobium chlorophenolicum L-1 TaxID=690566 RepID=F6EU91_SPHCR|nr:hypothetical protein [Sphingobium chlorophenolicum]AEG48720.1 hypothetical protein Sphch_1029 [Sphingobium chlorophenolicum L-1]